MSDSLQSPPQLPAHVQQWSARALSLYLNVSVSTVKYHARQAYRGHCGRWEFNREQAQKVVDRIYSFGHKQTLKKNANKPLSKELVGF